MPYISTDLMDGLIESPSLLSFLLQLLRRLYLPLCQLSITHAHACCHAAYCLLSKGRSCDIDILLRPSPISLIWLVLLRTTCTVSRPPIHDHRHAYYCLHDGQQDYTLKTPLRYRISHKSSFRHIFEPSFTIT